MITEIKKSLKDSGLNRTFHEQGTIYMFAVLVFKRFFYYHMQCEDIYIYAFCQGGWGEHSCPRSATASHSMVVDRTPILPIERRILYHWANCCPVLINCFEQGSWTKHKLWVKMISNISNWNCMSGSVGPGAYWGETKEAQCPRHRITGVCQKVLTKSKVISLIQYICSWKTRFEHGNTKLVYCAGHHLTSVCALSAPFENFIQHKKAWAWA